ncbi:MAG: family 16 glycosylhydrolase [Lewinella sp.]|nr:family 16 glycosylhydrolase [Lewinella sp.]
MRFKLLALILCMISFLRAQEMAVFDDFEGNGTITTWAGDDCGFETGFANPFPEGGNTSSAVLRYHDTGGAYANVRFDVPYNFDLSVDHAFTVKIYVPSNGLIGSQPNQLSLKLQDGTLLQPWATQSEIIKPLLLDQWQELSFDFGSDPCLNLDPNSPPPVERTDFNRVLLQVNGENNTGQVVAYIDDLWYDGTISDEPNSAGSIFTELVWSDEFDQDGPVDAAKWHHQTQLPNGVSWFNGELQHYTNRPENAFVEDGHLHIVARRESFTDQGQTKEFTSARLNSKFAFTYGRVVARAKLPTGAGTWPAIWMLGQNVTEPGGYWYDDFGDTPWPACGEIDIMEHWGFNQDYVSSALHTPCSFGGTVNVGGTVANNASGQFHVYALDWYPDRMEFSLDGQVYYTYQPEEQDACTWPFDADQYLLLNVAMVGAVAPAFTSSPLVVDYIRVYQEPANATTEGEAGPEVVLYPNPTTGAFHLRIGAEPRNFSVTVTDLAGQSLLAVDYHQRSAIDLAPDLPAGLYFVTVAAEGFSRTEKLVIRR